MLCSRNKLSFCTFSIRERSQLSPGTFFNKTFNNIIWILCALDFRCIFNAHVLKQHNPCQTLYSLLTSLNGSPDSPVLGALEGGAQRGGPSAPSTGAGRRVSGLCVGSRDSPSPLCHRLAPCDRPPDCLHPCGSWNGLLGRVLDTGGRTESGFGGITVSGCWVTAPTQ